MIPRTLIFSLLIGAGACSGDKTGISASNPSGYQRSDSTARSQPMSLSLSSPAFTNGGKIPRQYTCEGADTSPPLAWNNVPSGAKSFALIVDDPDAPDPAKPQRVYVHWVVYNIPPDATSIGEASAPPAGAATGTNDFGKKEWGGPCPPIGRHRYFFKLYALDTTLDLKSPKKKDLEDAMRGHILAQAELMGTYQKGD
jgi:Raf kinase inhibitor-like YbhB/YbcL family protein